MKIEPAPSTAWRNVAAPWASFAALYTLFAGVVTYPVLRNMRAACYWYYDLGIYAEAVSRLALHDINPWLTGRQIRIFNDHFDPILWLVLPLAKLMDEAQALVLFESLSVIVATLPIVYLWRTGRLAWGNASVGVAILLFHPAVILALEWPAHPTTWAMAPAVFLGTAIVLRRDKAAFVSFLALLCCKEEFVYVGLCWAAALTLQRRWLWAMRVGGISVVWWAWVFMGRAYYFGTTMNYTQKFTQDIWAHPFAAFSDRFTAPNLPFDALGAATIFGALGIWVWRARLVPAWPVLALCLPIVGIRFIAKMWGFQYNAVTVGFCVAAFLPALMRQRLTAPFAACLLIALGVLNAHKVAADWPIAPKDKMHPLVYCPQTPQRLASLKRGFTLAMQDQRPLLAEQNLMANIASHPALYQLDGPQPSAQTYAAVLFEKPPRGFSWRFNCAMITAQLNLWRAQSHEVLIDDAYVFYARGAFEAPVFPAGADETHPCGGP